MKIFIQRQPGHIPVSPRNSKILILKNIIRDAPIHQVQTLPHNNMMGKKRKKVHKAERGQTFRLL